MCLMSLLLQMCAKYYPDRLLNNYFKTTGTRGRDFFLLKRKKNTKSCVITANCALILYYPYGVFLYMDSITLSALFAVIAHDLVFFS